MKKVTKSFRLQVDLIEDLEKRSRETGRSVAQIVEDALDLWREKPEVDRIYERSMKTRAAVESASVKKEPTATAKPARPAKGSRR